LQKLKNGQVTVYSLVQLDEYKVLPTHNNATMIVIQKMHALSNPGAPIGNPVPLAAQVRVDCNSS
jgi:hypothetical protein